MEEVWAIVERYRSELDETGELERKRRRQQQSWFWTMVEEGLKEHFLARSDVRELLPKLEATVATQRTTPTQAARELLSLLDRTRRSDDVGGAGRRRRKPEA
jgi:LAO/AO transport system kinase